MLVFCLKRNKGEKTKKINLIRQTTLIHMWGKKIPFHWDGSFIEDLI